MPTAVSEAGTQSETISGTNVTYRARVRVRTAKSFTTEETERVVPLSGRDVTIRAGERDQKLSDAKWLVFTASGFKTEQEGLSFGNDLRMQLEIASFACRLGIDGGSDRPTTWIDEEYAKSVGLIQPNERILPNVHGVMVIPDDDLTRFPVINATAKVTSDPTAFLAALGEVNQRDMVDTPSAIVVRILNQAFMTNEPLAQLVLAFSAVEELGRDETWTARQRQMLAEVAASLESEGGDDPESLEVSSALRSLHRLSLRQGVVRALTRLGLSHLKKDWDRLYGIRSGIFHGTSRLGEQELHTFAWEVLTLCGQIAMACLEHDGIEPPAIAKTTYPG